MDLRELIQTRRTVHNFTPEKVDDAIVRRALELSLWAPNHKLTFPWVYLWLGREVRAKLGNLNVEIKSAKSPISDIKAKAAHDNVTTPSHLIALGIKRSPEPGRQHEDYATLACSVQIASLYLWEQGIVAKWSTGRWSSHPKAYALMGVDPAEVSMEGTLMIGREQIMPATPERPALSQVLKSIT